MTLGRPRYPNEEGMIFRRTQQREFFFVPSPLVDQHILYIIACAQMRYGFALHTLTVMADHKHAQVTDRSNNPDHSELANVECYANSLIARSLNDLYGRTGSMWERGGAESFNFVETPEGEDKIATSVYILENPVEAELVNDRKNYPGICLDAGPRGYRRLEIPRPPGFFDRRKTMPEVAVLILTAPDVPGMTPKEVMQETFRRCNEHRDQVRARVKAKGGRFLGAKGVLRTPRTTRATRPEVKYAKKPRYKTRNPTLRKLLQERDRNWLEKYEAAKKEIRATETKVELPYGTFKLVEYYHYPCARAPT